MAFWKFRKPTKEEIESAKAKTSLPQRQKDMQAVGESLELKLYEIQKEDTHIKAAYCPGVRFCFIGVQCVVEENYDARIDMGSIYTDILNQDTPPKIIGGGIKVKYYTGKEFKSQKIPYVELRPEDVV